MGSIFYHYSEEEAEERRRLRNKKCPEDATTYYSRARHFKEVQDRRRFVPPNAFYELLKKNAQTADNLERQVSESFRVLVLVLFCYDATQTEFPLTPGMFCLLRIGKDTASRTNVSQARNGSAEKQIHRMERAGSQEQEGEEIPEAKVLGYSAKRSGCMVRSCAKEQAREAVSRQAHGKHREEIFRCVEGIHEEVYESEKVPEGSHVEARADRL